MFINRVLFLFWFRFSNFQESQQKQHLVYKLRHLYDNMKIHNWQLLITFFYFRISAIESTTEIRKSCLRTLRVWSGFQYMSSNLLMHSERLEGYLIVLLLLHGSQKKNSDRKRADFDGILSTQKLIYILYIREISYSGAKKFMKCKYLYYLTYSCRHFICSDVVIQTVEASGNESKKYCGSKIVLTIHSLNKFF